MTSKAAVFMMFSGMAALAGAQSDEQELVVRLENAEAVYSFVLAIAQGDDGEDLHGAGVKLSEGGRGKATVRMELNSNTQADFHPQPRCVNTCCREATVRRASIY